MSEKKSLPVKHRPKTIDEIIGNNNLVASLKTILERKTGIPATFLLHGQSGCGKTTIARIIPSAFGSKNSDVKEINVSNNNGVDDARAIIKACSYGSFTGNKKFIICNEVHRASKNWEDAMLEILEEPPENTHFILCTTEPEKLLKTIRTRCTELIVQPLTNKQMKELIGTVLQAEGADESFPEEAIDKIIKVAEGIPREALKLLDSVIDIADDDDLIKAIDKYVMSDAVIKDLCSALLKNASWKTIGPILKNLTDEPETVRRAVLGYMTAVLLNSGKPQAAIIIDAFKDNFYDSGKAGLALACFEIITD